MGQIEINSSKTKDLVPDRFTVDLLVRVYRNEVSDDDLEIKRVETDLKHQVVDLVKKIECLGSNFKASFNNLKFDKRDASSGSSNFIKRSKATVSITSNVYISVDITTRDFDTIIKFFQLVLSEYNIISISSNVFVTDMESCKLDLKGEVCKACRNEANIIVTNLGSEILGVDKIIYNSQGNFLSNDTIDFEDCDFGCDDVDFDTFSSHCHINYDLEWARGFVNTLLNRVIPISDSVTVVFRIK